MTYQSSLELVLTLYEQSLIAILEQLEAHKMHAAANEIKAIITSGRLILTPQEGSA